jgi:uncharacterized membrane protein YfcA
MDIIVIAVVAALASALTLMSGFGLGTILLPVFALFFPVPVAVAAAGVVHLLNNLFKGALLWRRADWPIVLRFGFPAIPAAILGAWLLALLADTRLLFAWGLFGSRFGPTGAGFAVGLLMILFALLEFQPWFQTLRAPARLMPFGGVVSGFFGGLTGHQGAFRSMFLLKAGLPPDRFIATGVMIAILVDISRLGTYAVFLTWIGIDPGGRGLLLVVAGTLSAFAGAWFATRHLGKMTVGLVRIAVASLMLLTGLALAAGLIGSPA